MQYPAADPQGYSSKNSGLYQICSDLNLDAVKFQNKTVRDRYLEKTIVPKARVLIVAGNIGNPWKNEYYLFLQWAAIRFHHIVVVIGMTEYSACITNPLITVSNSALEKAAEATKLKLGLQNMSTVEKQVDNLCSKFSNVHFLQKKAFHFMNEGKMFILLGCSLWAFVHFQPEKRDVRYLSLFHSPLMENNRVLDWLDIHEMYQDQSKWISKEISEIRYANQYPSLRYEPKMARSIIMVVTSFSPSPALNTNQHNDTNLESMMTTDIKHWICGTTRATKTVHLPKADLYNKTFVSLSTNSFAENKAYSVSYCF